MSLADLFSALADPTRMRVLEMLYKEARPVHVLAAAFDISRPAISRHLRVLKEAGLVKEIKKGRENVYSLQAGKLKPGIDWLERHRPAARPAKSAAQPIAPKPSKAAAHQAKPPKPIKAPAPKAQTHPVDAPQAALPAVPQLSFFDL